MAQRRFMVRIIPALLAATFSGYAAAAGFQLLEQNASGLGNAFAGSAAVAEDASTIFFNPAGMMMLPAGKMQFALAVDGVKPTAKFSDSGSILPLGITNRGGNGGDAGDWSAVPSAYFAVPITERIRAGIGISAPFGLKTEYDPDWVGRFRAIKSDVKTYNFNPSIAFKVNDMVSLGVGANYQKLDAELTNAVNFTGALCGNPTGSVAVLCGLGALNNLEGTAKVNGDDWAWGYNLGAMFQVSPTTRVGVSYRSAIKYHVTGDVDFSRPAVVASAPFVSAGTAAALNAGIAAATPNGPVKLDIKLPDVAIVSAYQKLTDRWEMMGDISWTGWSKIPKLEIFRTNGTLLSSTTENWRDTWRVALGASYTYNEQWKSRFGLAYDQTPVKDEFRTPRLPDNSRYWVSIGGQYKPTKDAAIDVGYAHLFMRNASINDNGGSATSQALSGVLKGDYDDSVDIVGVQYTQSF